MDNKLAALINLAKHPPEKRLDQAIETLEKMKKEAKGMRKKRPRLSALPCGKNRAERALAREAAVSLPGMREEFRADDRYGAV
jgi:beta-glucosidase-like glycosyl hydrolase